MGLSFRSSLKVGPFRLSASKSGISVSAGIRGLRVGTGPRGSYVSMTAHGITVRESLPGRPRRPAGSLAPRHDGGTTGEVLHEIASADTNGLRDSSSVALLAQIAAARNTVRLVPLLLFGWAVALAICISQGLGPLFWAALLIAAAWTLRLAYRRDALRCLVPIFFELEEPYLGAYERVDAALASLRAVAAIWHIDAQGRVRDPKYHAGASSLVKRHRIQSLLGQPPSIRANLDIPQLLLGAKKLVFMPDRMLVFEGSAVGALSYSDLRVTTTSSRFIEEGIVPHDAKRIGTTWRYVNKHGGPDKRFKSNPQLPELLYEKIELYGPSGFHEVLESSRLGAGQPLASALEHFGHLAAGPPSPVSRKA
jgi:hypothetical protein